jgi:hypothetical protein
MHSDLLNAAVCFEVGRISLICGVVDVYGALWEVLVEKSMSLFFVL